MNNNLLGEQIARFRKTLGMTQEDLGKAVGISAQAVSRWECGGAPDVTLLPTVADTLGVTVDAHRPPGPAGGPAVPSGVDCRRAGHEHEAGGPA